MKRKLAVILVSYNQKEDIAQCLESFSKSKHKPYQIIISDNGSSDGSIDMIRERFPDVQLVMNNANIGYAAANNSAFDIVSVADGDYVLLLNSDTVLGPNFFENLLSAATRLEFDIVGPKIKYFHSPERIWFAGGYLNQQRCLTYHRGLGESDIHQYDDNVVCDFVSGCALLIKRSLFRALGGYNPHLFLYCEDLDLCLRARQNGARIGYASAACLYHKTKDHSIADATPLSRYYYVRNMLYAIRGLHVRHGIQYSPTDPLLSCIVRSLRTATIRPLLGIASFLGIFDFLVKHRGRCRQLFEKTLSRMARSHQS